MKSADSRWSLVLAAFAVLFAGSIKAAGPAQNADALISDCKTITCLRNLLRGPAGPAGPPGRSAVQDVYAGSFRMGRLIGIDVTAQCSDAYDPSNPARNDGTGLMGLIETSTGWLVHLCLGAPFKPGDVGVGMTEAQPRNFFLFKSADCTGQAYAQLQVMGDQNFDFSVNSRGVFGKLMGKPRVLIVPTSFFGGTSEGRSFAFPGPMETFSSRSGRSLGPCFTETSVNPPVDAVPVIPNNPSITGLPDSPETPYTVVDVQ